MKSKKKKQKEKRKKKKKKKRNGPMIFQRRSAAVMVEEGPRAGNHVLKTSTITHDGSKIKLERVVYQFYCEICLY